MIVRKFNESTDINNTGVHVIVDLSADKLDITFNKIINTNYYMDYHRENMTNDDMKSLIYYSVEEYLLTNGKLKYNYILVDENGTKINIENLDEFMRLNKDTIKFNV